MTTNWKTFYVPTVSTFNCIRRNTYYDPISQIVVYETQADGAVHECYKCDTCDKVSIDKGKLLKHIAHKHTLNVFGYCDMTQNFHCNECDYAMPIEKLKLHSLLHLNFTFTQNDSSWKCLHCDTNITHLDDKFDTEQATEYLLEHIFTHPNKVNTDPSQSDEIVLVDKLPEPCFRKPHVCK